MARSRKSCLVIFDRSARCWAHTRRKFYEVAEATGSPWRPRRCAGSANSTPSKRACAGCRSRINATSMLVTSHIDVYEDHLAIRLKSADDGKISDSTDEAALPICRRPKQRIWRITLQARPRSADRAQSPVAISQNGNISKNRRRLLTIWAVNCQIGSLETAC